MTRSRPLHLMCGVRLLHPSIRERYGADEIRPDESVPSQSEHPTQLTMRPRRTFWGMLVIGPLVAVAAAVVVTVLLSTTPPDLQVAAKAPLGGLPLSPDGRWALPHTHEGHAVVSTDPNGPRRADGQPVQVVTWKGHSGGVGWSPDSRYVAWYGTESPGVVTIHDLEHPASTPRSISLEGTVPPTERFIGMLWSPDGSRILFETANCEYPCSSPGSASQLYLVELAAGTVSTVSQTLSPGLVTAWSPDGQSLGLSGGLIVDLHGNSVRDLLPSLSDAYFPPPMPCTSGPIWSPDGSRIAIIDPLPDGGGVLFMFDPGASEARLLAGSACAIIGWSPDGTRLVFGTGDSFATRWVQSGSGGGSQPMGSGSDIWIIAAEGGTPQGLKHIPWGDVPILTWAPVGD